MNNIERIALARALAHKLNHPVFMFIATALIIVELHAGRAGGK